MRRQKRNLLTLGAISLAIGLFATLGVVQTQKASQAVIGGAFELVGQDGKIWKDTDFRGKPMLVYFGYSYCPDICPTALYNMTQAMEKLGNEHNVQPIFITIDQERDTTAQLQTYAQNFHKDFVMLTGSKEQIAQATKAYHVHAARASEERGDQDYLMDHSSIIYLMDKNGKYVAHFNHQTLPDEIAARVLSYLEMGE